MYIRTILEPYLETYVTAFDERRPFSADYRLRRSDGEYRWVHSNGVPLLGPDQAFSGFIGSCLDMTERKLTEDALVKSEKLAAMGRLAGIIAHEINNPLEAISNAFYLLRRHPSLGQGSPVLCEPGGTRTGARGTHNQTDA